MGDGGLPTSWRKMNGYGSHTYQWINAAGRKVWVKYHFYSQQGVKSVTNAKAAQIAGADSDYYLRDLFDAIEHRNFPKWTVSVQIMPYEDAKTYRFNPFDLTKIWPHADYPLIKVGEFELNRNPENYFAQIEQAAFEPSNLVPGIDVSPDKMLLARIFSYADAHRYRIGTNYNELPVNRPRAEVHSMPRTASCGTSVATRRRLFTRRTRPAAPKPIPPAPPRRTDGSRMANLSAPPTRCGPTTTISANREH